MKDTLETYTNLNTNKVLPQYKMSLCERKRHGLNLASWGSIEYFIFKVPYWY